MRAIIAEVSLLLSADRSASTSTTTLQTETTRMSAHHHQVQQSRDGKKGRTGDEAREREEPRSAGTDEPREIVVRVGDDRLRLDGRYGHIGEEQEPAPELAERFATAGVAHVHECAA